MDQISSAQETQYLTARLPARIGPILRGEFFEDPLDDALRKAGGAEVTGGGTMMAEGGDIAFIDIEIRVEGAVDPLLETIAETLERLDAPRGTKIMDEDGTVLRRCGTRAIAALTLDGATLPQEVYDTCSADDVIEAMLAALGPGYGYAGYHTMATTTAIYFHGDDYEAMRARMEPAMAGVPLCQNATLRQTA